MLGRRPPPDPLRAAGKAFRRLRPEGLTLVALVAIWDSNPVGAVLPLLCARDEHVAVALAPRAYRAIWRSTSRSRVLSGHERGRDLAAQRVTASSAELRLATRERCGPFDDGRWGERGRRRR